MAAPVYFIQRPEPQAPSTIRGNHLILVEGQDELHFFDALLSKMAADPSKVQVLEYGGKDSLE
jgi:hypothetical protein